MQKEEIREIIINQMLDTFNCQAPAGDCLHLTSCKECATRTIDLFEKEIYNKALSDFKEKLAKVIDAFYDGEIVDFNDYERGLLGAYRDCVTIVGKLRKG